MKDTYKIWGRILQRSYSAVSGGSNVNNYNSNSDQDRNLESGCCFRRNNGNGTSCGSTFPLGLIGLVAIAIGMLVMFIKPYDIIFKWKVLFVDGGEIFELWRSPPVDLYLRVHLFNITNAEKFMSGEEKMKLQEVGPYVYREIMSHSNITFNNNGTLSAVPRHPLEWVPELSSGDHEKDQLILPHIALLSIADVVSKKSFFTRSALNFIVSQTKSEPLVKMSPKEFMFGYESTLMTLGYRFLPNWINFEKLGLIDRMYDFDGDYETVFTGENDITRAGVLDTYRGSETLPQWEGYCGNIRNASDGTKFPSNVPQNETIYFFRKSLCRAKPMVWVNNTHAGGLRGSVYKFAKNANDNGKFDEKNKCFCREGECLPAGLLDVRACYYGFPIALSYPHFLDSDPSLLEQVDGLTPDRRQHESYFVIQPESGLPLDLAVRYQINMALRDVDNIPSARKFSNMVIPMLWTENRLYGLPPYLSSRFQLYINILPMIESAAMYVLFTLGVIFMVVSLRRFAKSSRNAASNIRWMAEEENAFPSMERKLSTYVPETSRRLSDRELKLYFTSLVTPLNQTLEDCDAALQVQSEDDDEVFH